MSAWCRRCWCPGNATGAAHRVAWDKAGVAGVFQLFCEHHRVEARFCNPCSGWEKGSVGNAVGFVRRNLMVPQSGAEGYRRPARWLLGRCGEFAGRAHCRLGRTVSDLFGEDCDAMAPLPCMRFDAVEWESRKADKEGVVAVDGHRYLAGPSWRGWRFGVGLRAFDVEIRTGGGWEGRGPASRVRRGVWHGS